jgi:hypothetical protein
MSITENIAADQAAVASAQAALDTANAQLANAQLAKDQAALDAAQPHMSLWDEVVAEADKLGADVAAPFAALAARAKALLGV